MANLEFSSKIRDYAIRYESLALPAAF